MKVTILVSRFAFVGALLVPILFVGCGGGGSGPQPLPTVTSDPLVTPSSQPTPAQNANFALSLRKYPYSNYEGGDINGDGTAKISPDLRSIAMTRPRGQGNPQQGQFQLDINSPRTLVKGAVIKIGKGASGSVTGFVPMYPGGRTRVAATWYATSGDVQVVSVSANALTLRCRSVVFAARPMAYASGRFICNGTIRLTRTTT